jgi:hypothetical protein
MSKYSIGIKSKVANGADILKYNGECYYRTNKQSYINNKSGASVGRYYIPVGCPTLMTRLTTMALCAHSCELGEHVLHPNQAMAVDPGWHWFQFKFTADSADQSSIIKFNKHDGAWFAKTLKYTPTGVVFDPGGPNEHTFLPKIYPTSYTFVQDNIDYCLTYAHPGSYVFVMAVSSNPAHYYPTPSQTPTATPGPTPTPTLTSDDPMDDMLCDGINFCRHSTWPSSGSNAITFWFDAADLASLRTSHPTNPVPNSGDKIVEWLDISGNGKHVKQTEDFKYAPTYLSAGKVGGPKATGPCVKFIQSGSTGSDYLSYQSDPVRLDHRAVFFVATTDKKRGNGKNGVISACTTTGGAGTAYGTMFALQQLRSHWVGPPLGSIPASSIYSDSYTGGDGGQLYMNGSAVPDNHPVVGYGTSTYLDGAVFGGVRTHPSPALMDGLCIGAQVQLGAGNSGGWDGEVNEVIILDEVPSDEFRQEIEGYLAWKWGLVEYLPVDHPCKHGVCQFPTPTPTVEPTPLPPTPYPTPVWPKPPIPSGPPDGVNLVTATQLFDALTQRSQLATMWAGGMYERDWNLTKNRLDAVTGNDNIIEFITGSNKYIMNRFAEKISAESPGPWQTQYYEHNQPGISCPGGEKLTLRTGWNGDWEDNVDTELLYCLGGIQVGTLTDRGKTVHELLTPEEWAMFTNAVRSTSTDTLDTISIESIERMINIPLSIDTPGFMYNIIDAYLPLTSLYRMEADHSNPSPLSHHKVPRLNIGHNATRVDVAAHLMYFNHGLAFWQERIVFDDRYTVELAVKLPGARDDQSGYDNMIGNLPWEVQVEVIDTSTNIGYHERVETLLPSTPSNYIPESIPTIDINIGDSKFKITPYCGKWRGSTTVDLINNASTGKLPVLFARIDREKLT